MRYTLGFSMKAEQAMRPAMMTISHSQGSKAFTSLAKPSRSKLAERVIPEGENRRFDGGGARLFFAARGVAGNVVPDLRLSKERLDFVTTSLSRPVMQNCCRFGKAKENVLPLKNSRLEIPQPQHHIWIRIKRSRIIASLPLRNVLFCCQPSLANGVS